MSPRRRGALAWSFVMNGGRQFLSTLLVFVLAGLLGPEDFGVVAIAMVYISFVTMLLEQGMSVAIVQRDELRNDHLDTAFWMILAASAVLMSGSIALADWWGELNSAPELGLVITVLSVTVPITGLSVVQRALLQRDLDMRSLALRTNASVAFGGVVGIGLAVSGYGVWALVAQRVGTSASALLLLWGISRWRPRFDVTRSAAGDLIGFSVATLVGRLGVFASNRSDALLMGLFFGPAAVGLYRLAERLMRVWVSLASRSIQFVALPEFSRLQDELGKLRASVLGRLRTSATFSFPPLAVVAAGSHEVTRLLGAQWEPAAAPLTLLCGSGMVLSLTQIVAPLLQALGRPQALAMLIWATAVPFTAAFLAAGLYLEGADAAAQAHGIAMTRLSLLVLFALPVHLVIACRLLETGPFEFVRQLGPALAASLVGVAVVLLLRASPLDLDGRWLGLVVLAVAGGVAVAVLLTLDAPLRKQLSKRLSALRTSGDAA